MHGMMIVQNYKQHLHLKNVNDPSTCYCKNKSQQAATN